MHALKNKSLLCKKAFINGRHVSAKSGNIFSVYNPFNGEPILSIPDMGVEDAIDAIDAASKAFALWRTTYPKERSKFLLNWHAQIKANLDDLAYLLSLEQGKPLAQAKEEVKDGLDFVQWYAEEAKRIHGHTIQPSDPHTRRLTIKHPIGVVAIIAPWNYPICILLQKCAPAIAAGCTVVFKPAEDTPLSSLALIKLAHDAGLPSGVINIICTKNPDPIGRIFSESDKVQMLTFTGSTKTGKKLMQMCSSTVKKACFELGGNSPFIIFEDGNLNYAINDLVSLKFTNSGQICVNANRVFIHENIYDTFLKKLIKKIQDTIILGSGQNSKTTMGPVINEKSINKISFLVEDAVEKGATVELGGKKGENPRFYEPTVLSNLNTNMKIFKEEIFGPVCPLYLFKTEEEVIELANATKYGLAAYFYSENISRVYRMMEAIEAGSIGANTTSFFSEMTPFGGMKHSGIGREGGLFTSLDDFLESKTVAIGNIC